MRHSLPSGDLASILERALDLLLGRSNGQSWPRRVGRAPGGSAHPDHVTFQLPCAASYGRGTGAAAHLQARAVGATKRRSSSSTMYGPLAGGDETTENIELRCRAHNQYEADPFFARPPLVRERPPCFRADSVRTEFATTLG